MKTITSVALALLTSVLSSEAVELLLREDFREVGPKLPILEEHLVNNETIKFEFVGADPKTRLKLSHHPHAKDPHYLYFGPARAKTAGLFHLTTPLDLSDPKSRWKFATRNTGVAMSYLMVKSGEHWWISNKSPSGQAAGLSDPFKVTQYFFHKLQFEPFDVKTCEIVEREGPALNWSSISGVGLFSPHRGGAILEGKTRSTARIDWFEIHGKEQDVPYLTAGPKPPVFFEEATPFFGSGWQVNEKNSSNRGVILRLEDEHWVGFDTDMMRPAAVWKNAKAPLSLDTMASKSYPDVRAKASKVPQVLGDVLTETSQTLGIRDSAAKLTPIYDGLELRGDASVLKYHLGEMHVEESWKHQAGKDSLSRLLTLSSVTSEVEILLDKRLLNKESNSFVNGAFPHLHIVGLKQDQFSLRSIEGVGTFLKLSQSKESLSFQVTFSNVATTPEKLVAKDVSTPGKDPFPSREYLISEDKAKPQSGYEVRTVQNPRRAAFNRSIRPMDIDFDSKGTAYICTIDGDVWKVTGIDTKNSEWKRFAFGLYELTNIEISDQDEIFVLGRDQITQLIDKNNDDSVDTYVCVNNRFNQTLHTRNFSLSMELLPNGNFAVAKGGIVKFGDTGHNDMKHRGMIIEVPRDQGEVKIIADGLRMPYVGVDHNGEIFASDQQGHYVPSTPVHHITRGHTYGFERANLNQIKASPPLVWYPYLENRSGAGFVKFTGPLFAPYRDLLVHVSWNGSLFGVVPDTEQPFSWKLPIDLNFPCLNGEVHPVNGKLYLAGIANTGYRSTTDLQLGLGEVAPPAAPLVPHKLTVKKEELTVSFSTPVEVEKMAGAKVSTWDVVRTPKYGSGHFSWDGSPGENEVTVHDVAWSEDKKVVTIKTSPLYNSSVLRIQLDSKKEKNKKQTGKKAQQSEAPIIVYAQVTSLETAPEKKVESEQKIPKKLLPASVKRGSTVFKQKACIGCHSLKGASLTGPPLNGIGAKRTAAELKESILKPNAVISEGYTAGMPSFLGILSEQEIKDVVAYLLSQK